MASPEQAPPAPDPAGGVDELSDRQVEVLVYRVLAAVIAFLVAAGIAVLINAESADPADQQVDAGGATSAVGVVVHLHRPA